MADLRLLMCCQMLAVSLAAGGCIVAPVWTPTLEGRVWHKRANKPVPGAIVVARYGPREGSIGGRCTRSDEQGRFVLPGHFFPHWPGSKSNYPVVQALHIEFGYGQWSDAGRYRRAGDWIHRRYLVLTPNQPDWEPLAKRMRTMCAGLSRVAGDVRHDGRMHATCQVIFDEECATRTP